jgi:hypothetical protein
MDYVEWCEIVLAQLAATLSNDPEQRGYSNLATVAQGLFGLDPTQGYGEGERLSAFNTAAEDLQRLGLTAPRRYGAQDWGITEAAERYARDRGLVWEVIQWPDLPADSAALVHTVNQLSPHEADGYAWLETIEDDAIMAAAQWQAGRGEFLKRTEMLQRAGSYFLRRVGPRYIRATYSGLVWEKAHRHG